MASLQSINFVLPVVSDSWALLRKVDVFRLLESIGDDSADGLNESARIVGEQRPDLAAEAIECAADIAAELFPAADGADTAEDDSVKDFRNQLAKTGSARIFETDFKILKPESDKFLIETVCDGKRNTITRGKNDFALSSFDSAIGYAVCMAEDIAAADETKAREAIDTPEAAQAIA